MCTLQYAEHDHYAKLTSSLDSRSAQQTSERREAHSPASNTAARCTEAENEQAKLED